MLFLLVPLAAEAGPVTIASDSDYAVTTWKSEDGLPHDNVNCITQTRDGYLWVGTTMGLTRFDGMKFEIISPDNFPELRENRVINLFEDHQSTLWISLENGRLLSWKNGEIRLCISEMNKSHAIVRMVESGDGGFWVQTFDRTLRRLKPNGDTLAFSDDALSGSLISDLAADGTGKIWVAKKEGVKIIQDGKLQSLTNLPGISDKPVNLIVRGRRDSIWVIRGRQMSNLRDGKIINRIETSVEMGAIQTALETADNRLWISTGSGGLFCRERDGQLHSVGQSEGIRGNALVLFEDSEGNLWSASYGGGLNRIRPRLFKWHTLSQSNIPAHYAFNVCSDPEGNVWARLDANILVNIPAQKTSPLLLTASPALDVVRALFCDRNGALWIGGEAGKLYRKEGEKIEPQLDVGSKVSFISALFEDSRSNLWVGFTGGVGAGYLRKGDPKQWRALDKFPVKDVRAIAEATDGSLWFGTYYGGAIQFKNNTYRQILMQQGLPSDYVRCLYADKEGCIWMGTLRGLCRWKNDSLCAIGVKNGLWNDSISSIVEDGSGNFWISSFGGVFRVEKRQLNDFADGRIASIQCVGYNRNDGLPGLECPGGFQPAGTRTPDGRIWFPTEAGVVSVDADHLVKNAQPSPVLIEQLLVEGKALQTPSNSRQREIGPGKHHLEFRFTAFSFTSPEKVRFRHKLEGLEADWSPPDDRRIATYDYVPAGKYVFKVRACNNDGLWNPEEASLALELKPYFWQTLWFITGMAFFFAAILFAVLRRLEKRKLDIRLENIERQQALERERARIAKDIHDDAGATLAQIAFLSERIDESKELAEIGKLNKRIENAARQTIQSIDEIVWAVSPKHDTLESLANYLTSFAQEHLELAGIRCVLDVLPVLEPQPVSPEIRHNILLTAREALQNVVAHSNATEVRMSLVFQKNLLEIIVADDGNGFEIEKISGSGNGMTNMRKRLEEIHGTLEVKSEPGKGTVVKFSVLIERLHVSGIGTKPGKA